MSMENCKLHMLKSNDGRNQEVWVNRDEWMRPRDIISEGSDMPHEVLGLLRKWSHEINQIRSEFQSKANIGCAHVDFVYDSSVYKLQPAAIAATKDMVHHIAEMIQKDLKHIGCPYTHYEWDFDKIMKRAPMRSFFVDDIVLIAIKLYGFTFIHLAAILSEW